VVFSTMPQGEYRITVFSTSQTGSPISTYYTVVGNSTAG